MASSRIVKIQPKGMVTIPAEFRKRLKIEKNALLEAKLTSQGVTFIKVQITSGKEKQYPKAPLFTEKEVKKWLKEDALNDATIKKLKNLIA